MSWLLFFLWLAGALHAWMLLRGAARCSADWRYGGAAILAAAWPLYALAALAMLLAVVCLAIGPLRDWRLP